ncbi:MAG TPA: hypothetical protein VJA94_08420 [Candidatus Angelobacter sp.]
MRKHAGSFSLLLYVIFACTFPVRVSASPSIPAGIPINVRIDQKLSSETSRPGDVFTGTLAQPLSVNGAMFPRGTAVRGQVIAAKKSGRLSDPGELELTLTSIGSGSHATNLASQPFLIKGESHSRSNVGKIGGSSAAGAIIGGIADGGKGAMIGAGVGAGAGTAVAAATGKKPAVVEPEAVLVFLSNGPGNNSYSQPSPVRQEYDRGHNYRESEVHRGRSHHDDDDDDEDDDRDDHGRYSGADDRRSSGRNDGYIFGERDRDVLETCLSDYQFESLPPGIQKKLERGGTLPPGQAKRLHALPSGCTARLSRPPRDVVRIILGDRVILLDRNNRILDIFFFER